MAKKSIDYKKLMKDFWYGKPHQERRLGDLYIDKTGLYKHREWRGFKDTMYYFYNIWMYNYAHMVMDVVRYGGLINFAKGVWRYRWVGQTYLPVLHWFDRGMEGMRGEGLKASAWHYRGMVNATIFQFQRMFSSDANLRGGKKNYRWHHNVAHNETVWGGVFYPWHGKLTNVPMEMIPYFVTCHVNSHTVLNYIDAVQSIGLPGDPCPMCQAEAGLFVLDDSTPGTVRFNDKSTVVLICGLSLRIERQVLRRDVQIGSTHVVIVVGTSREHHYGEHGQCTEEQFPNATLFHKQLNFRVI